MISMPFALAPAGVLGTGSVVARPDACAAVRPSLLPRVPAAQGTGVPAAGLMARLRGAAPFGTGTTAGFGAEQAVLPLAQQTYIQNDGTTLGIHSSGRPQS